MARLDSPAPSRPATPAASPIPASVHYATVAWLRWRLFANSFRRKGGKGELAARLLVYPIAAIVLFAVISGAGGGAFAMVHSGRLDLLMPLFYGIFVLQILTSINIAPPGLSFDPNSLIRFPITFTRFLLIRLVLGLLSASNVIGTAALLAAATGATVARPSLAPAVFTAALALAFTNMLFTRMVFIWVDRWLSTRRAREIFVGLLFFFSIGIQYLNFSFNNIGGRRNAASQAAKIAATARLYHHAEGILRLLPPGLAAGSVNAWAAHNFLLTLAALAGVLAFAALFLAIFAWRIRREFHGENLSEVHTPANPEPPTASAHRVPAAARPAYQVQALAQPAYAGGAQQQILVASLHKEWLYLRRNTTQFYGLFAPLAMVILFSARLSFMGASPYSLPGASLYALLGASALAFNIFGLEGAGAQFYFFSPVPLRTVVLVKNLVNFALLFLQPALVLLVLVLSGKTPPAWVIASTFLWVVFAALVNTTVGNVRSISAPRKVEIGKVGRHQVNQLSALLSVAMMLALAALLMGLIFLARLLGHTWLPLPVLALLAFGAFALYRAGLDRIEATALANRESLFTELAKAS